MRLSDGGVWWTETGAAKPKGSRRDCRQPVLTPRPEPALIFRLLFWANLHGVEVRSALGKDACRVS